MIEAILVHLGLTHVTSMICLLTNLLADDMNLEHFPLRKRSSGGEMSEAEIDESQS